MGKSKVLLISPGNKKDFTKRLPLALLFLAENLMANEYEPVILDMTVDNFSEGLLKNAICVGITSLTGRQILYGLQIAEQIRKLNPKLPIVWGGIHPSSLPVQTVRDPYVDIVVCGEGELTFLKIVTCLNNKQSLDGVEGIVYKENGEVFINKKRPFLNFDKRNYLPYDLLSLDKYQLSERFEYQSSRGCPYRCIFCYNHMFNACKWRMKSSNIVLEELEEIMRKFHPKTIFFVDDEFFINKKRVEKICKEIIEKNFDFKWHTTNRADIVAGYNNELLELLERSGCMSLAIGAESGSPKMLEFINKKITVEDTLESARKLSKTKITPVYSFVSGFPGETLNDLYMSLDLIDKLWKINSEARINGLFLAAPYPGTPFFQMAIEHKFIPPSSLGEWGTSNLLVSNRYNKWLPIKFLNELQLYSYLVRFLFMEMYTKAYLKRKELIRTLKYRLFIIFRLIFYPFFLLERIRWQHRNIKFPIDLKFLGRVILHHD
ncbi:B12-binding domain-containing radical SAM protein [candidate division WOR-3 bacterium]|nr:B12-binding domain-containing radical SAM protein [candidate division WOR-3 bacterium]